MKKTYILIAMAAIAAVACNKEVLTPATDEKSGEEIVVTRGTRVSEITGLLEGETKTGYEMDTDDQGQPVIKTFWRKDDMIAVTDGQDRSNYIASADASDASTAANFTGEGSFELTNGLWAVYPGTSLISFGSDNLIVNVHDVISRDKEGEFTQWGINDLKIGYGAASDNVPAISFKNVLTTLKVNLKLAADHGIDFKSNEVVKSVTVSAVNNEPLAGDFSLPLTPNTTELTPVNPVSNIICNMSSDEDEQVELSTDYLTTVFFHIAPGAYSELLVTINTSVRTIQRSITINTTLERNNFYNINLTKIKNALPYTVVTEIPVAEGGWGDDKSTSSKSSGAVVALWDGVYDDTQVGRYYTVQLSKDENFTYSGIVETTNIHITYSSLYGEGGDAEGHIPDGQIAFCGLTPNTRYYYRVKVMGVGDEYYSQPNTFITTARKSASGESCDIYIDFDSILSYGAGDFMGRAVATYPGATPVSEADDADWNDRLGFVSTSEHYSYWNGLVKPAASYKVGNTYDCMLIGHEGNPNSGITYSSGSTLNSGNVILEKNNNGNDVSRVRNRPGYIQLGTGSNPGHFKVPAGTEYTSSWRKENFKYQVTFKACVYNNQGLTEDAKIKVSVFADAALPTTDDCSGDASITISYDSSYTWTEYSVTVTTSNLTNWLARDNFTKTVTIATDLNANNKYVRVFLDDVKIKEL